jgi:hypothetical protein
MRDRHDGDQDELGFHTERPKKWDQAAKSARLAKRGLGFGVNYKGEMVTERAPFGSRGNFDVQLLLRPRTGYKAEVDMEWALRLPQKVMCRMGFFAEANPVEFMVRAD